MKYTLASSIWLSVADLWLYGRICQEWKLNAAVVAYESEREQHEWHRTDSSLRHERVIHAPATWYTLQRESS